MAKMKTWKTTELATIAGLTPFGFLTAMRRRDIDPVKVVKHASGYEFRDWGQDAYDWAVNRGQEKLAKAQRAVAHLQAVSPAPAPAPATPPTPTPTQEPEDRQFALVEDDFVARIERKLADILDLLRELRDRPVGIDAMPGFDDERPQHSNGIHQR